jgi:type II secretory pathway component PulF
MDRIKLKIPVFGKLIRDTELARFSRTFSMLLKNGVPMLDSLEITSEVITNNAIKEDIDSVYNDVKAGMSITSAIKKRECFPLFVSNMAAVGEEGGFLDKALLNIARNYETEMDRVMKIITALLEPAFILIMGLVVGFIVVAMLLPVFEISLTAH